MPLELFSGPATACRQCDEERKLDGVSYTGRRKNGARRDASMMLLGRKEREHGH